MILSREQILSANDRETRDVDVPEWGGTVRVRALSVREANEWRKGMLKASPKTDPKTKTITWDYQFSEQAAEASTARMVALACVDDTGKELFSLSDVEALMAKSGQAIARIVKVVREISGLNDDSAEEAAKNSQPNQSDSSSSS